MNEMKTYIDNTEYLPTALTIMIDRASKNTTPLLSLLTRVTNYNEVWAFLNNHKSLEKTTILNQTVWLAGKVRITLEKVNYV